MGVWFCPRLSQFFYGQALVAIPLFASGNYVAHYALWFHSAAGRLPHKLDDVSCPSVHASAPTRVCGTATTLYPNALLLNLPIHSIHHLVPKSAPSRFTMLSFIPNSPTMPLWAVPLQIARARRRFLYTRSRDALQQPLA